MTGAADISDADLLRALGVSKRFAGRDGARPRGLRPPRRRDPRADGRERRRQVDADEDPLRRAAGRRGPDPDRRDAGRHRLGPRRRARRHRHHPPGAEPRPRALGRRQHLPRPRAAARRPLPRPRRHVRRGADAPRPARDRPRPRRPRRPTCASASSSWSRSPRPSRSRPRILIMDEPTSALSAAECERLFRIVRQLAAEGVGIVYISHRIEEVIHLADRVTVLRDGRHVVTAPIAEMSRSRLISAMVGRDTTPGEAASEATGPVVLSVRNLGLEVPGRHGWRRVLGGVDLDLHAGEVLGVGGLLGSGRTEILESLFGASGGRVSGTIRLDGQPVDIPSPARRPPPRHRARHRGPQGRGPAPRLLDPRQRHPPLAPAPLPLRHPPPRRRGRPRRRQRPPPRGPLLRHRRSRSPPSPAATSRRSSSASGSPPTPASSSSTSPPAASTSAPSRRSTP